MGIETNGGFKNITISNCVIKSSDVTEPKTSVDNLLSYAFFNTFPISNQLCS